MGAIAVHREEVLCVPRDIAFPDGTWHGFVREGLAPLLAAIGTYAGYRPRHAVEDDASQQQIIPYCVIRHRDGRYLLTKRLRQSSEKRLHHLYSLGVGGHINRGDNEVSPGGNAVSAGLLREWNEEISCLYPATARLVGIINDDSSPVSRVHLGLVFLVEPEDGTATVKETEKLQGEVFTLEAMRPLYLSMESWSQLVYDDLVAGCAQEAVSPMVVTLPASV